MAYNEVTEIKFDGVEDGRVAVLTVERGDGTRSVTVKTANLLARDESGKNVGVLELHWGCVKEGAGDAWSYPPSGAVLPPGTKDPDGDGIAARSAFRDDGSLVRKRTIEASRKTVTDDRPPRMTDDVACPRHFVFRSFVGERV